MIYGRSDSRSWVASAAPRVRAWALGKPAGRESVDAGAAARSRRPPAPGLDQFRAAVAAEEGRGRRDLLTNVVNTSAAPARCFNRLGEIGTLSGRRRLSSLPVFVVYRQHFGELSFRWDINLVKR